MEFDMKNNFLDWMQKIIKGGNDYDYNPIVVKFTNIDKNEYKFK